MSRLDKLLDAVHQRRPGAIALARFLSTASQIERPLLRAARIELGLDVGAESELWWSELVESRPMSGLILRPDVGERLASELAKVTTEFERATALIRGLHASATWQIRFEDAVRRKSARGAPQREIEELFLAAAKALVEESDPKKQRATARWILTLRRRLPEVAKSSPLAGLLDSAAGTRLDGRCEPLPDPTPSAELQTWMPYLVGELPSLTIHVALLPYELRIGFDTANGKPIQVPRTSPIVLEVSWHDGQRLVSEIVELTEGELLRIQVTAGTTVAVTTVDGNRYRLTPETLRGGPDFGALRAKHRPLYGRAVELDALLNARSGWTALAGPRGSGKTTLICALIDALESEKKPYLVHFCESSRPTVEGIRASLLAQLPSGSGANHTSLDDRLNEWQGSLFLIVDGIDDDLAETFARGTGSDDPTTEVRAESALAEFRTRMRALPSAAPSASGLRIIVSLRNVSWLREWLEGYEPVLTITLAAVEPGLVDEVIRQHADELEDLVAGEEDPSRAVAKIVAGHVGRFFALLGWLREGTEPRHLSSRPPTLLDGEPDVALSGLPANPVSHWMTAALLAAARSPLPVDDVVAWVALLRSQTNDYVTNALRYTERPDPVAVLDDLVRLNFAIRHEERVFVSHESVRKYFERAGEDFFTEAHSALSKATAEDGTGVWPRWVLHHACRIRDTDRVRELLFSERWLINACTELGPRGLMEAIGEVKRLFTIEPVEVSGRIQLLCNILTSHQELLSQQPERLLEFVRGASLDAASPSSRSASRPLLVQRRRIQYGETLPFKGATLLEIAPNGQTWIVSAQGTVSGVYHYSVDGEPPDEHLGNVLGAPTAAIACRETLVLAASDGNLTEWASDRIDPITTFVSGTTEHADRGARAPLEGPIVFGFRPDAAPGREAALRVTALAWDDEARMIVAGFSDGSLRWYAPGRPEPLVVGVGHAACVTCLVAAGSTDGTRVVFSGSEDGTVRRWNHHGRELGRYVGHQARIGRLSCAGELLISASDDGTMRIWRNDSHSITCKAHTGAVRACELDPSAGLAFSGGEDGTIAAWHLETGKRVAFAVGHAGGVMQLSWFGGQLVSTGGDGVVRGWTRSLTPTFRRATSGGGAKMMQSTSDGRLLCVTGEQRIDLLSTEDLGGLPLGIDERGEFGWLGDAKAPRKVWNLETGALERVSTLSAQYDFERATSNTGRDGELLAKIEDARVTVEQPGQGLRAEGKWIIENGSALVMDALVVERLLITCDDIGILRVVNIDSGDELERFSSPSAFVQLALSGSRSDGTMVLVAWDVNATLWVFDFNPFASSSAEVFLSYPAADREVAQQIVNALEHAGMHIWWDQKLAVGGDFEQQVRAAVSRAAIVLAIFSHRSLKDPRSEEIDYALQRAREGGCLLVPVNMGMVLMPQSLRNFQWVEAAEGDVDGAVKGILAAVRSARVHPRPTA